MAIERIGNDDAVAKVKVAQETQQAQRAAQQAQVSQAPVVEKPKETKPEPKNDKESFDAKKIGVLAESEQKLDGAKNILNIIGLTNIAEAKQISGEAKAENNDLAQAAKDGDSNKIAAASQEKELNSALAGTKQEPVAQEAGAAEQVQNELKALLERGNAIRDKASADKASGDLVAAASASSDAKNK